jgi:hypothetical protein
VTPIFDYASCVYDDLHVTLNIRLQRLQNACIRFIFDVPRHFHVTEYYVKLKWLKLEERRLLNIMVLLRKILKLGKPEYLFKEFKSMSDIHERQNRFTRQLLQIPNHRTVKYANSFKIKATKLYNNFEMFTLNHVNDIKFKQLIRESLLSRY